MKTQLFPTLLALGLLMPLGVATLGGAARAQTNIVTAAPTRPAAADMTVEQIKALGQGVAFPYEILSRALSKVVTKDGLVNYGQAHGSDDLALFVRAVGEADINNFPVFTDKDEKGAPVLDQRQPLAFYINAYNALFLKAVSDAYPVSSVSEIPDLYTKKRRVAGQEMSLDELRKKVVALDARALFVLMDGYAHGATRRQRFDFGV